MSHTRAIWDDGRELGQERGSAVVALGIAVALSVVVVNIAMVGRVSMFFDLWFVLLCLGRSACVGILACVEFDGSYSELRGGFDVGWFRIKEQADDDSSIA